MTYAEFRKHYPSACADAFADMRFDTEFWNAVEDWDLTEIGKRVMIHLKGRKTNLEAEIADEGFDADEAARDVVRESQRADAKEFKRLTAQFKVGDGQ